MAQVRGQAITDVDHGVCTIRYGGSHAMAGLGIQMTSDGRSARPPDLKQLEAQVSIRPAFPVT